MTPDWFSAAVSTVPERGCSVIDGAEIAWFAWGDAGRPGLVLIHGGAAHAQWWSFVAPALANRHRVVALDLSGHGDSAWRTSYSVTGWAREVMTVAADAGISGPFVVVGHSMGGFVAIVTAALHGADLRGAIIVDAPVRRPDPESEEAAHGRAFRNPKTYPDLATAMAHFHLIPAQPRPASWIVDHVARTSLRQVADGPGSPVWTWKFDPRALGAGRGDRVDPVPVHEYLAAVRCRVSVFYGELSEMVTPDVGDYMNDLLGRTAPFVEIPQAHHHVILDQPLAFIAALRAILADWDHTIPRR